jgi:hypothetical protein
MAGQNARISGIHPDLTRLEDSVLSVTGNGRTPGARGLPWACWRYSPRRLQLNARKSDGEDQKRKKLLPVGPYTRASFREMLGLWNRRLTALRSAAYRRASARIGPSRILRSTTYQVSLRVLCRYHIQIYLITELHPNWPTQQLGQSYECWTSYQVLTQESPGRAASPMFPMALCPVACIYAISITSRILPSI